MLEEVDGTGARGTARAACARGLAARRAAGEPLQYVLGHWPFRTLDLLVTPAALIPRPETEQLAGLALAAVLARRDGTVVCDLGCGTGAIALAVASEAAAEGRRVEVHATDVSSDALELARRNARRVGADVALHLGSWYDAVPSSLAGRVDVLCANPPYVAAAEREGLARELDFEPPLALVSADAADGTPGFAAVCAVVAGASRWLANGGTLLVEHGATQGAPACDLARRCGLCVVADHRDLAGLPRILEATTA